MERREKMRTIKFRGKRLLSEDWEYGNLIQRPDGGNFIETGDMRLCPIQDFSIGQFTGLHDENGKEIYEGDIVYSEFEDGSNGSSLVGWNEKQSCFGVMDEYAYRSKLEGFEYPEFQNHVMLAFMRDAKLFEVIGNIHDNPELLKID